MIKRVLGCLFLVSAFSIAGCTVQDNVTGRAEVINKSKQALNSETVTSIVGSYGAGCGGRSGNWTISIGSGPAANEVSVRKNDSACVLTVTNIVVNADDSYFGVPTIPLNTADTYRPTASTFNLGAAFGFYANAKIDSLAYASNFTVRVLVSDTPGNLDETTNATYAAVYGSAIVATVPAPGYTASFGALSFAQDAANVVDSATGYVELVSPGPDAEGNRWAVSNGPVGSSIAAIEAAWAGAASTGTITADPLSLQVPSTALSLVGETLPLVRTIIVRRDLEGVSSFQTVQVTFAQ